MSDNAQPKIELIPLERGQRPIVWLWIDAAWSINEDDYMPRDIDEYFDRRVECGAILLGVYYEGEFGGLITLIPRLPCTAYGYLIFKRSFERPSITIPALELAIRSCWGMGYHKLTCLAFPDNQALIRLLEESGAIKEATLFSETQRGGKPADIISFAFLES